jgi:hypothetical protein
MVASRSDPFALWERVRVPPAKPLPNSCSKRFAWEPSEASKNGLNPPPPNPAKPPPKGFRPNASGSNPGCCEVDPYWSYAVRFLSSLRIYHWGCASLSRTKRRLWIDRDTYFVGFLDLLKFLPCVFVRICIRVKFASELSGASETSACDKPTIEAPGVRKNKFSLSRLQSHLFSHQELDTGPSALTRMLKRESVSGCQRGCFRVNGEAREITKRTLRIWEGVVTVAVLSSNLRFGRLLLRGPVYVARVRRPFKERWPEQVLQVIKEEMLVEVASPAIPPRLRLRTKRGESTGRSTEQRAEDGHR